MERKSAQLFSNCPWEGSALEGVSPIRRGSSDGGAFLTLLGEKKEEGTAPVTAFEQTREGEPKAYIRNWFYKPPFGYPRYKDLDYYRSLAASIYVDMCETAIIDEVCSVQWEIVAEDTAGNEVPGKEKEVEIVKSFFDNPNTNPGESWDIIIRMMLPDLLEINSGILIKTFNAFGKMVEVVARDGIAFTKNPDIYGMYTHRADLILVKDIMGPRNEMATDVLDPTAAQVSQNNLVFPTTTYPLQGSLTEDAARDEGAYFQYGWNSAARPVPFGKRELVWVEKKVRTDDLYGRSAMEVLHKTVQTLVYAVEHNLEYFSDNSIPPGVLGLEGLNTTDMKAFAQQWIESQKVIDELGNWKKKFHKLAMVNKKPTFERLGFTNAELELIESQKWWSKMVWAAFGMTATEMGFVEDAKGNANQIVQSSIAKKRIIYPILRLLEYYINTQIIPEFGFEGIRYKYKVFDVDDETKKWGLYKLQTEADLKTINEVRNAEGLDPVEWGDKSAGDRNPNAGNNFNFNDPRAQEMNQVNNQNQQERDRQLNKPKNPKKDEKKELDLDSDLGEQELEKSIKKVLKDNEKKVLEILDSQKTNEPIIRIKSVDDIPGMIKKIFALFTLKAISDVVIKVQFTSGWDQSEKVVDQNVPFNEKALGFLQEHTFANIKGMTEEIANDLKQELERGIINGEGVTKLKERVSKVFDVGENRAEMIARTEINRANNNGKLLAVKGSGLEYEKKWITHKDDRTSPICNRLDGQTVGISENFKDSGTSWEGQSPPSHVNCRSTMIFIEKEE